MWKITGVQSSTGTKIKLAFDVQVKKFYFGPHNFTSKSETARD